MTGGAGFVGAGLTRRLVEEGHDVTLLVRLRSSLWRLEGLLDRVRLIHGDLADLAEVGSAVDRVAPEWVFNLAAHGAYSWQSDLREMVQTNVTGTAHLLRACIGSPLESFVHAGSSSEYGFKGHAPSEDEVLEPNSDYAVTKAAATHFCRHLGVSDGLPTRTLRLYSAYGPWEDPRRLIPVLIVRGLRGELPPLVEPEVVRDFIHIDDVVEGLLAAASAPAVEPGAVYNLGTGSATSLRDLVALTRRMLGIGSEPVWGSAPNRSWDTSVWVADSRKIRAELGWSPRRTLEEGLRGTIEWLKRDPRLLRLYEERLG